MYCILLSVIRSTKALRSIKNNVIDGDRRKDLAIEIADKFIYPLK